MASVKSKKGVIGILTGGGDVPGLNPAIRAVTIRAIREGYQVYGIRRGWEGMITIDRNKKIEEQDDAILLTEQLVNRIGRTGGTFLHTSRTRPDKVKKDNVPALYKDVYKEPINDLTGEVKKNIDYLGLDYLIPIGGDDTLSYGVHMHKQGMKVIAIPKTMDGDVPGTDYCIGFGTCISRTIELTHELRTPAGSHERFLVIEVFGRYAGFSALLPTMAGAANRCLIPEYEFDMEHITELMVKDRNDNPSKYSVLLVSEGAKIKGGDMMFQGEETDAYGHKKLGGIGDVVSEQLKNMSAKYNNGRKIDVINQRMGYIVRSGAPDALDSIVPMAFGNLALDLVLQGTSGRLVSLRNGRYDNVPIDVVTSYKKVVDVNKFYDTDRYRPKYEHFSDKPQLIMTSDF
ncbi:MAG: 6-phosphofructokinase [Bacteroidetes bacterium]|nr:6-phosphofructokinase [Bacteroidota bacterium]